VPGPKTSDYFAELYVAGRFAEAGWNIYFPHRDQGFDFVISKTIENKTVLRPVQVKGKYPWEEKGDKKTFGYIGKLTARHLDMILAIPFFSPKSNDMPACIAYLPPSLVRKHSRGYKSEPAQFKNGEPKPRAHYAKFFGNSGLALLELPNWNEFGVGIE
jgi:hypothetical protein